MITKKDPKITWGTKRQHSRVWSFTIEHPVYTSTFVSNHRIYCYILSNLFIFSFILCKTNWRVRDCCTSKVMLAISGSLINLQSIFFLLLLRCIVSFITFAAGVAESALNIANYSHLKDLRIVQHVSNFQKKLLSLMFSKSRHKNMLIYVLSL